MVDAVLATDDVEDLQNELMAETAARQQAEQALRAATSEQSATASALTAVLEELAAMRQTMATMANPSPPQVTSTDASARLQPIATSSRGQRDKGKGLASTSSALPQAPASASSKHHRRRARHHVP